MKRGHNSTTATVGGLTSDLHMPTWLKLILVCTITFTLLFYSLTATVSLGPSVSTTRSSSSSSSLLRARAGIDFSSVERDSLVAQIQSEPVMMYSKDFCRYCHSVKALFAKYDIPYTVSEINVNVPRSEMLKTQAILMSISGQKSVPNIFIGGVHVGGNDTIYAMLHSGELKTRLDLLRVHNKLL